MGPWGQASRSPSTVTFVWGVIGINSYEERGFAWASWPKPCSPAQLLPEAFIGGLGCLPSVRYLPVLVWVYTPWVQRGETRVSPSP